MQNFVEEITRILTKLLATVSEIILTSFFKEVGMEVTLVVGRKIMQG